ncbi:cell wall-active antibiotics response protein LiaF [Cohnella boryungensis]|uniref:Cell wall-active antibiotics response protein LiaF n=1 Tax=Cohnella boryungensis TaxID=768479 RepID=A0ABV8SDM9_9BACL
MQSSKLHRLLWGVLIIIVGVVFLLNQTGLISMNIGELFRTYWPVILIVVGLQGLLLQHRGGFWWNSVTVLIGGYFLGRNLDLLDWELSDFLRIIGPIAIILFGLSLIFRGDRRGCRRGRNREEDNEGWNPVHPGEPPMPPGPPPAPPELEEFEKRNTVNLSKNPHNGYDSGNGTNRGTTYREEVPPPPKSNDSGGWKSNSSYKDWHMFNDLGQAYSWKNTHSRFIGDFHLGNDYWELRPMNISHFIGDTVLDLTKAQIPVGETRVYISSFIGDVKVYVPNDLSVGMKVVTSSLIGDVKVFDQKRGGLFNQTSVETSNFTDNDKRVVLIVSSFIGDVRVMKVG